MRIPLRMSLIAILALVHGPANAGEIAPRLEKIAETGVVTIGHRAAEAPFSYVLPDGTVTGFSIEICLHVVDAIRRALSRDDISVEYVPATSATRFVLTRTGAIDIECAATTNNAERRELVDYSYPHFLTATQFVSRREDGLHQLSDLAGRTVSSASGTVNIAQLNELNRERKLNIAVIPTRTNPEAFEQVVEGRAAAFVMDGILLAGAIAETPDPSRYELSTETLSRHEPYGMLLPKNDPAFKSVVNEALADLYASEEIETLYRKWFMSPIPPKGTNLDLPMSPELAERFAHPTEYLD